MTVTFVDRPHGPERLVCEAELHLEGDLAGMKLVGFSLWRSAEGDVFVSLPARAIGGGSDRRYFDLLRSIEGRGADVKRTKALILAEYERQQQESVGTPPYPRSAADQF